MVFRKPAKVCKFLPLLLPRVVEQTSDADGADIPSFEEPEKDSETIFQLHANDYWLIHCAFYLLAVM